MKRFHLLREQVPPVPDRLLSEREIMARVHWALGRERRHLIRGLAFGVIWTSAIAASVCLLGYTV